MNDLGAKKIVNVLVLQLITDYQKFFAQTLWRISILPFQEPNSPPVERALKFLIKIYSTIGTAEDKLEAGFTESAYPMYFYILKLFNQVQLEST